MIQDTKDIVLSPEQKAKLQGYDAVLKEIRDIYVRKNHDYGDSFSSVVNRLGDKVALGQIAFKVERLMTLVNGDKALVNESKRDAIRDMVNYGIMWMAIIDEQERDNDDEV